MTLRLYQQRWPIGTRQRVWLDVLLYTGLRRGDAVVLGRQHVRDGVATIKTEKTDTEVTLADLASARRDSPRPAGDLAFICNAQRQAVHQGVRSAMPSQKPAARLASRSQLTASASWRDARGERWRN